MPVHPAQKKSLLHSGKRQKEKPNGKGEEGTRQAFLEAAERTNTASDIVLLHYNATKLCCQAFLPGKNFFEKIKKGG